MTDLSERNEREATALMEKAAGREDQRWNGRKVTSSMEKVSS